MNKIFISNEIEFKLLRLLLVSFIEFGQKRCVKLAINPIREISFAFKINPGVFFVYENLSDKYVYRDINPNYR